MFEQRAVDLPRLATVVGAEEHAGGGAEVERLGLFWPTRRDVPHGVQRQAGLLRQPDLLRAPPRPPAVLRALDRRTVDAVVGRCVERAVTRVGDRVVHAPAPEQRALGTPVAAFLVTPEHKQPLGRADECENAHRCT
jgi:hypothetical protein